MPEAPEAPKTKPVDLVGIAKLLQKPAVTNAVKETHPVVKAAADFENGSITAQAAAEIFAKNLDGFKKKMPEHFFAPVTQIERFISAVHTENSKLPPSRF